MRKKSIDCVSLETNLTDLKQNKIYYVFVQVNVHIDMMIAYVMIDSCFQKINVQKLILIFLEYFLLKTKYVLLYSWLKKKEKEKK